MSERLWEVIGGSDKGGIIVREGAELASPQDPSRLATGSLVREVELLGERLHFTLLSGSGPKEGWVSLKLKGKDLLSPATTAETLGIEVDEWRLFAISDLHVDYPENKSWVENLPEIGHLKDAVILAGDISHSVDLVRWTLQEFRRRFGQVFYCVGNHELWIKRNDARADGEKVFSDSYEKFEHLMNIARDLGCFIEPTRLGSGAGSLWIVPLQSWYQSEFGKPSDEIKDLAKKLLTDFHQIVWPAKVGSTSDDAAAYFDEMNESISIDGFDAPVVTFSHFLPRLELMPSQLPESMKLLRAGVGTKTLEDRLRAMSSKLHVFGHSHANWYTHWNGVHYIQNAIRYPHERKGFRSRVDVSFDGVADPMQPFLVWSSVDPDNFCLQPDRCGRGCPRAAKSSANFSNKDSKTAATTWSQQVSQVS